MKVSRGERKRKYMPLVVEHHETSWLSPLLFVASSPYLSGIAVHASVVRAPYQ
jgi:hypothetical protein